MCRLQALEKLLKEIEDERQRAQDQKQRLLKASNARLGPSVLAKASNRRNRRKASNRRNRRKASNRRLGPCHCMSIVLVIHKVEFHV
jgi:hypothetical protein